MDFDGGWVMADSGTGFREQESVDRIKETGTGSGVQESVDRVQGTIESR
jgi:hypothetical protein